ncbi:MAG: SnoaL-like polyketide cyclase, partial [Acidobacteria bacterium]|nr:SnoaL-like polyketide cyclase [Acidobacteriota bacterium]
ARLIDRTEAAVIWSQRGRHMGDFCGLAGTGRSFVIQGVFLMCFRGGRIASMLSLYDFTGLLVQIGVLKAKPF